MIFKKGIMISALGAFVLACAVGCAKNESRMIEIKAETEAEAEAQTEQETESETETIIYITTEAESEMMLPTASETEAGTQMSLPTQPTEMPTEPFIAPTTAIPATEVQIIIETTNAPQIADISLTAEEEQLLMRVASLEAGNQGWIGMALVMNVVLNRSATFNLSIKDVILAPRQFSVVGCEKWNNGYIAPEALTALQAVKDGWDGSQGALFFCAPRANSWHKSNLTYLFTGYGHEFYR